MNPRLFPPPAQSAGRMAVEAHADLAAGLQIISGIDPPMRRRSIALMSSCRTMLRSKPMPCNAFQNSGAFSSDVLNRPGGQTDR